MSNKRGCCVEGCERPHVARGLCSAHWQRLRKTGGINNRRPIRVTRGQYDELEEYFWTQVDKLKGDGCWLWLRERDRKGYGRMRWRTIKMSAHRVAWQLSFGLIPPGMLVCHSCDNPACCRPDHLFLGTQKDNMTDAVAKGRIAAGDRHGTRRRPESIARGEQRLFAKLTDDQVREIRHLVAEGAMQKTIAEKYAVSKQTIGDIVRGRKWKHV